MRWVRSLSFPDYEVSETGLVRRLIARQGSHAGKVIGQHYYPNGYVYVPLQRDGKRRSALVHRLVAEAFIGPSPFEGALVCHNDGTRDNNHASNVRWDNASGNQADRVKHGTDQRGEKNWSARITAVDVERMRDMHRFGEKRATMARWLNLPYGQVWRILDGDTWRHV